MCAASADKPRNITPSIVPMITRVERAFFHEGSLNAGTPFEIASTPVTAAPPDANACSTTNSAAPWKMPDPAWPTSTSPCRPSDSTGRSPNAPFANPYPSRISMFSRKK